MDDKPVATDASSWADDRRYPRPRWIRLLRWIFIRKWLIPTIFLVIYILNAILSFYLLIIHSGFGALLNFSNIAHALLLDRTLGNSWVILLSLIVALVVNRGLGLWVDKDETNESNELERRRLNQIKEQEKQCPPGLKLRHTFELNGVANTGMAWSPDGQTLASVSYPVTQTRDPENGKVGRTRSTTSQAIQLWDVAFHWIMGLGTKPMSTTSQAIQLWDPENGQLLRTRSTIVLISSSSWIRIFFTAMAWSPDGLFLASANKGGYGSNGIQLWDTKTWQPLRTQPTTPSASSGLGINAIFITAMA